MAASIPLAKRLACDRCHAKKIRCSVQSSERECGRCIQQSLPCTFSPPAKTGRPVRSKSMQQVSRTTPNGVDESSFDFAALPMQPRLHTPDVYQFMGCATDGSPVSLENDGSVSMDGRTDTGHRYDTIPSQAQEMLEVMSDHQSHIMRQDSAVFDPGLVSGCPPDAYFPSIFSLPNGQNPTSVKTEESVYPLPNQSTVHLPNLGQVMRELTTVHQGLCDTTLQLTSQDVSVQLDGSVFGELIHLTERTCELICPFFFPPSGLGNPNPIFPSLDYASALFFIGSIVRAMETYELIASAPGMRCMLDKLQLNPQQLASDSPAVAAVATAQGISWESDSSGGSPTVRIGNFAPSSDLGKWLMVNTMLYQVCMLERLLAQMRYCFASTGSPASVVQLLDELAVKSARVKEGMQDTTRPVLDKSVTPQGAELCGGFPVSLY